jgi:hypothetical protein
VTTLWRLKADVIAARRGRIPAKDLFADLVKQHDWTFRGFQRNSKSPLCKKAILRLHKNRSTTAPSEQLHDYLYNATTVFFACVFSDKLLYA